ncbi:MAG: transcription termination factor NusA [Planctomycetota bacterium]
MSNDLLRIIDSICRDKNIDRDSFVADLENAMVSAIRKAFEMAEEVEVHLDLLSGKIAATVDNELVDMQVLGRIAAQTAKQVIIQKTRERERNSIYEEFSERRGTIVTGNVVRAEGGNLLINIGRTEGFLPRSEQIPGETHHVGERIRVLILEVRELPNQVKIILSRSHREFILKLFEMEVPEVAEQIIEIKALAREAGYRTKAAVSSIDSKVDAVGACVGVRGSRIKNIVEELGGEKIDIVRWNESSQILIQNALKPAEVQEIALCFELDKATVVVAEDQLSLAIGKRGQNVRLAARLTGWDIDILTPAEYNKHLENLERVVKNVEGVDDLIIDKLVAMGCVSAVDLDDVGPDPLVNELELTSELAERIVEAAGEEAIRQEEERIELAKTKAQAEAAGITTEPTATPAEEPGVEIGDESTPAAEAEVAAGSSFVAETPVQDAGSVEPIEAAPATGDEVSEEHAVDTAQVDTEAVPAPNEDQAVPDVTPTGVDLDNLVAGATLSESGTEPTNDPPSDDPTKTTEKTDG